MWGPAADVFAKADMIEKVKEPQAEECKMLRKGQVLFTYLHLAADAEQARGLVASGAIAIAYETVTSEKGGLPLLAPMSEVAGRMSVQVAAHFLERPQGGRGVLMSGATGIAPASVTVLGAGIVGSNAAMVAAGMGAEVVVLDPSLEQLRRLVARLGSRVRTKVLTPEAVGEAVRGADAVIGAALIPGALAPP